MPPSMPLAVTDKNLRDPFHSSELDQGPNRIVPVKHVDRCAVFAGNLQIAIERGLVLLRQIGLADISDNEIAVKAIGVASAAFQKRPGIGSRSDTDKDTLLNPPVLVDSVSVQVVS